MSQPVDPETDRPKLRSVNGGEIFAPLSGLILVMFAMLAGSYFLFKVTGFRNAIIGIEVALLVAGVVLIFIARHRIRSQLLVPLAHMRRWAILMRQGNLSAQVPIPSHGDFTDLARDINNLGSSLRSLSRDMDSNVHQQTQRLAQKTHSLQVLYDVAASTNTARDLADLLSRHLHTMAKVTTAPYATVRVITNDLQLRLADDVGLATPIVESEILTPVERCICAQNLRDSVIRCSTKRQFCGNLLCHSLPAEANDLIALAIPLRYQNKILGVYNLFVDSSMDISEQETQDMLTNIAQHTSLAIEKSRLEDDSKRVSIMQERTMLAHELHDSLAQTLASLRFRMAVLENTLEDLMNAQALSEVAQIREDLDTANSELRELLTHFRVRMDDRGLIPATENLVHRFEKDTNISVFFQNDCTGLELPPEVEIQVLHIIQEALSNIRKHSHAEHVRVLFRCRHNREYHVLIEDDGIGIDETITHGQPGEHIGLKIMRERAKRINAELTIDTEPGEGTRVELDFNAQLKPGGSDVYQTSENR